MENPSSMNLDSLPVRTGLDRLAGTDGRVLVCGCLRKLASGCGVREPATLGERKFI